MAALIPPPNTAGVQLPVLPSNPATLADISNARDYVSRLSIHNFMAQAESARNNEIGAAEAYTTALVFSHSSNAGVAPAWLSDLLATIRQTAADVKDLKADMAQLKASTADLKADVGYLRKKADLQPFLLANSVACPDGPLYNPNDIKPNGSANLLACPRTRDELFSLPAPECIVAAAILGLPPMAPNVKVQDRRRQIAMAIGVNVEL